MCIYGRLVHEAPGLLYVSVCETPFLPKLIHFTPITLTPLFIFVPYKIIKKKNKKIVKTKALYYLVPFPAFSYY